MTDLVTVPIGPLTYQMTQGQLDQLGDVPARIASEYGNRLDAATVLTRAYTDMPLIREGMRARAMWRERSRRIILSTPFGQYDVQATLGHEATHTLSDDWLTRAHRKAILPYLEPLPAGWYDLTIGDNPPTYEASPEECFATWGAVACLGTRPAFPKLYQRRIQSAHYATVKAIALASPDAPDPVAELQRQLAESQAALAAVTQDDQDKATALLSIASALDVQAGQLTLLAADARNAAQG